jgi:hypothetical protein
MRFRREESRRVLRDAFLAVVMPGHYPLLRSFFLIPNLLAVEGKKKSRQLGSHLRKEAERIPAAKPRKKRVLPTTTSWLFFTLFPPTFAGGAWLACLLSRTLTPTVARLHPRCAFSHRQGYSLTSGSWARFSRQPRAVRTPSRLRSFPPNIFNRS